MPLVNLLGALDVIGYVVVLQVCNISPNDWALMSGNLHCTNLSAFNGPTITLTVTL
jgi:hypothetical protein